MHDMHTITEMDNPKDMERGRMRNKIFKTFTEKHRTDVHLQKELKHFTMFSITELFGKYTHWCN